MSEQTAARTQSIIPLAEDAHPYHQALSVEKWPPPAVVLASVTFHWPLTHASLLLDEHCISNEFTAAGFKWRMKFSAKGKNPKDKSSKEHFASFFIENTEASKNQPGPLATFSLGESSTSRNAADICS